MSKKNDGFTYHHNFKDYSVELDLELEVYRPRFGREEPDDCSEIEILKATVMEDIEGCWKKGQDFDTNLLDYDDVADAYFNRN